MAGGGSCWLSFPCFFKFKQTDMTTFELFGIVGVVLLTVMLYYFIRLYIWIKERRKP